MSFAEVLQQLVNALSLGSTYALLALGLAMVFSIIGLINFAYGELVTLGGFTMWITLAAGVPWQVVIPLTLVATTLASIAMERIAFRPLMGAGVVTLMLTSFAISFLIQTVLGIGISQRAQAVTVPEWTSEVVNAGAIQIPLIQIVTTATTALCFTVLILFLRKTILGTAMRAAADDFVMVRLMGISASWVVIVAFSISGLLAGAAALLYISRAGAVEPTTGLPPLVSAFIAVVIGGMGSLGGAVLGGFVLGFAEVFFQATLPADILPFRNAFALLVVIGVLLARPQGLLGRPERARV